MHPEEFRRGAEVLRKEIEDLLNSMGFLCRVFGRGKSKASIEKKLANTPGKYAHGSKLIQDTIGIRVVLYSPEDIAIVQEILRGKYSHDPSSSTIDRPTANIFSVTRLNLIFAIPAQHRAGSSSPMPLDSTFEVQIRTILSEGWHEVEHDLRYKRPSHWEHHDDLSRNLNGVVATLETAEWAMRKIFDDLAYRHYRSGNWGAMIHTAARMRISTELSLEICAILDSEKNAAKNLFRLDRPRLFFNLAKLGLRIPVNLDNVVFLWNYLGIGNQKIWEATPVLLKDAFAADLENVYALN